MLVVSLILDTANLPRDLYAGHELPALAACPSDVRPARHTLRLDAVRSVDAQLRLRCRR